MVSGCNAAIVNEMQITILDNKHISIEHKRELKAQIKVIFESLGLAQKTQLCVTFVDDNTMRALNKTYRGIDRTTDVLSFPQDITGSSRTVNAAIAKAKKQLILGDIIISIDTARRHTKIYGNSIELEIKKLIIHGTLHLLEYDHKKKKDAAIMRKKEEELLTLVNSVQG